MIHNCHAMPKTIRKTAHLWRGFILRTVECCSCRAPNDAGFTMKSEYGRKENRLD